MALYITLQPISYTSGNSVIETQAGYIVDLTDAQAATVVGQVSPYHGPLPQGSSYPLGTPLSGNLANCIGYPAAQLTGTVANNQLANSSMTVAGNTVALGGAVTADQITGVSSNGVVKRTGANTYAPAVAGTDFQAPLQSPVFNTQTVKTANYTAAVSEFVPVSATGGQIAVTLPTTPNDQSRVAVKKVDSGAYAVNIVTGGSDVINIAGTTNRLLKQQGDAVVLQYSASQAVWYVVSADVPIGANNARSINATLNVPASKVQLTDNCYATGLSTTVTSVGTYRAPFKVGVAGGDIQLGFGNWKTTSLVDTDPGTSVTFSAAFEDTGGVTYQATFGGQTSVTLPGGGLILSDPLPLDVAVGDTIYVRVYISSGTAYSNRYVNGFLGSGGGFTATTNLTASGAGTVTTAAAAMWMPMCIVGTPTASGRPKSVVIQGDSIAVGLYDGVFSSSDSGLIAGAPWWGGGGYLMRALSGSAGIVQEAVSGDGMNNFVAGSGHFRRGSLTKFGRYAVITYGRNDLNGGRTQAQIEADILTQATRNITRGLIGSVVTTITPYTNSTDRWSTTTNQSLVSSSINTIRVAHNTWVRGGCPIVNGVAVAVGTSGALLAGQPGHPILGYIDVAATVESSLNSGLWAPANRVVTDAAISSGSGNLTSATANFTSADLGKDVVVAGAGASGADMALPISAITSSTQVALAGSASTTVSGATCVIGPYTEDGIHPATGGNAILAAAIQSPLLALLA